MKEKKTKPLKKVRPAPIPALDRCRAVLSVWSECRKPSEVCQAMNIQWTLLRNWEQRALEGMLKALAPRQKQAPGPELSRRLRRLLKPKENKVLESRLEKRLVKIQESTSGNEKPPPVIQTEKKKG